MKSLKYIVVFITLLIVSCGKESECAYKNAAPEGCDLKGELNLSTGIDTSGNLLSVGKGVVDPFWRVLNKPPLLNCTNPLQNTVNGSAYVINYANSGDSGWVNQPNSVTLAPVDLGNSTGSPFGCNNANNSEGKKVPYVFERSFCVLEDTTVNLNFTFRADDQIYFELINNATNTVLSTSATYIYSGAALSWNVNSLGLSAGSYSIRGYLVNTGSTVLGMSFAGSMTTTGEDLALSNNIEGCCENNVISILNILDSNCDKTFNTGDQLGKGWTFNLKDASNTIIDTKKTDVNGNIFFAGLPNGTYTVEIVNQTGWTQSTPASVTITVNNNKIEIIEFFSCNEKE